MYTVHSKTLKRCTFATDGHDPFIYDSDIGRYVPVEELVLSLSKGPEGEPALSAVEGGAAGAGILKKLFAIPKVFRLSINMPANKSTAPSPLMGKGGA